MAKLLEQLSSRDFSTFRVLATTGEQNDRFTQQQRFETGSALVQQLGLGTRLRFTIPSAQRLTT
jgi:hypothetical protein